MSIFKTVQVNVCVKRRGHRSEISPRKQHVTFDPFRVIKHLYTCRSRKYYNQF